MMLHEPLPSIIPGVESKPSERMIELEGELFMSAMATLGGSGGHSG